MAPLPVVVRHAHALALLEAQRDTQTMDALAQCVLPSELSVAAIRRAADEFREWMRGYREGAELNHGYGTSRLRFAGPTPATRWMRQLDDLDARAKAARGQRFAELAVTDRAALVRDVLSAERLDRMPSVGDATHVAVALLAHFYESSEAADLCYQAQIGAQTCRPLAALPRKPLPLAKRGDA
jgi:hypothetical protein